MAVLSVALRCLLRLQQQSDIYHGMNYKGLSRYRCQPKNIKEK